MYIYILPRRNVYIFFHTYLAANCPPDPGLSYSEEHHQRCYDLYIEMRENGSLEKGLMTPQYMSADGQIGSLVDNGPSRRGADLKLDSI